MERFSKSAAIGVASYIQKFIRENGLNLGRAKIAFEPSFTDGMVHIALAENGKMIASTPICPEVSDYFDSDNVKSLIAKFLLTHLESPERLAAEREKREVRALRIMGNQKRLPRHRARLRFKWAA